MMGLRLGVGGFFFGLASRLSIVGHVFRTLIVFARKKGDLL